MKRALLCGIAAFGFSTAAHAQWVVSDPAVEMNTTLTQINTLASYLKDAQLVENTGRQIVQLGQTVSAVAHGNTFGVAELIPELAGVLPATPITGNGEQVANAFTGVSNGAGEIGNLSGGFMQMVGPITGTDYRASQILSGARSAAAQMAFATRMFDSGYQRQSLLPQLFARLTGTPDVKAAVDANARVAQEGVRQSAQTNQLLGAVVMQNGQRQMREAQEEQMNRCTAENFVSDAKRAEEVAASGQVQLVTTGSGARPCQAEVQAAASGLSYTTQEAEPGGGVQQASVNLGGDSGLATPSGGSGGGMMQQAWGAVAAQNAQAMGVNPDALAAVCAIESNCQNVANSSGASSASGPWQMIDSTYNADLQQALAQNPNLSATGGKSDPATQSIAAAQDLKNAAASLQRAGIDNPTMVDGRGYFEFGPRYGATLALASPDQNMANLLPSYSAAQLQANGVGPNTTVSQWRQSIVNRVGSGATAPILLSA